MAVYYPNGPAVTWLDRIRLGCAILFALPFVAFGLAIGILVSTQVDDAWGAALSVTFGMFFASIGLFFMRFVWRHFLRTRNRNRLKGKYPQEPWKWRSDWAESRVDSDGSDNTLLALWWFAVWVNMISVAVTRPVAGQFEKNIFIGLIYFVFVVFGLLILQAAIRAAMHRRKYGFPVFRIKVFPIAIGGQVSGEIELPEKYFPLNGVKLRIQCIEILAVRHRKGVRYDEDTLWSDSKVLKPDSVSYDGFKTRIPVEFSVPKETQETSRYEVNPSIRWRLTLTSYKAGEQMDESFELPVFQL